MARSVEVDVNSDCISSGMCRRAHPAVFGEDDQRRAVVLVRPVVFDDALEDALEGCPVEALSARDALTGQHIFP